MLDTETKRRIDTARDVLVGKVPDPKSQVEQITIALIYKFMDDMDKEAVELGGKPSFFTGDYEKYSWSKIFDPKLGGHEMLALYGDALATMNHNPNIPQLFREIFKNAYLPYRDPETLKLFLKTVSEFKYDHSERLGDAFEYLLSVLGSQGDAGQFRTPRHIIDFIVAVIQPKKNETILDPACGTAGFLISAFKHIMQENTKKNKGDLLTPDERKKLIQNIVGYDISPDMERLSLVNMYLHGFTNPRIYQYDTLTEQDKWNEYYDVIMANPPFMSPKGGIRPHKKFTVQANRSEVLFLDYIAEHLNPTGRAGVIVPEGIIFQSANAYKEIRKLLVKDYLWAVVSLPAGVFNPYSGVKTSILFLDKMLAKKSDSILFVKIQNDGFELGAQRREVKGSELPDASNLLTDFNAAVRSNQLQEFRATNLSLPAILVAKEKIDESEDYNLSGDRYKIDESRRISKFAMELLGDLCEFEYGKPLKEENRIAGSYPVYGSNGIVGYHNEFLVEAPFIVVGRKGSAGEVHYSGVNGYPIDTTFFVKLKNEDRILLKYLFEVLKSLELKNVNTQAGVPGLNRNDAYRIRIPLPPLTIQQEIVAKIEGYQKIIDGAKQVISAYKPHIEIDPEWEMVELGEVCDVRDGTHDSPKYQQEGYPLITSKNIKDDSIDFTNVNLITREDLEKINQRSLVEDGDILMPMIGTIGNPIIVKKDREFAVKNVALIKFFKDSKIHGAFLRLVLASDYFSEHFVHQASGSTQKFIALGFIRALKVPLPSLSIQQEIVQRIEQEQQLANANKQLIKLFEDKLAGTINRLWEQ